MSELRCLYARRIKKCFGVIKMNWISVEDRLPEDNEAVNVTWVNRSPARYYADIKGKPFTATAVYYHGRWYWWTAIIRNILEDCEKAAEDWEIDDCIDVTAWMPLPDPMKEGD